MSTATRVPSRKEDRRRMKTRARFGGVETMLAARMTAGGGDMDR